MDCKYEIVAPLGIISERIDRNGIGWTKEVNLVAWNGGDPKIDIREWNSDHTRMSKGATLKVTEAETLMMILHNYIAERSK